MSVTKVERVPWQGRGGGYQANWGSALAITATEIYLVETDNGNDDAFTVLADSRLPQLQQPHATNPNCGVMGRQAVQYGKSAKAWMATITYSSQQPRQPDDNPLSRPDVVRWTSEPYQRVVTAALSAGVVDASGNVVAAPTEGTTTPIAVTNSANDPFNPPIMDDGFDRVCTIQRNLPGVPASIDDLAECVNDGTIQLCGLSCPEGSMRLDPPEISELKYEANTPFYELTMRLKVRKKFPYWDWLVTNQGTQCFVSSSDNTKVPCTLKGVRVTSPVNLDKDGTQLTSTDPTAALFILYKRPRADFSVLRLPQR